MTNIPKDLIIIISGSSGIGKTTISKYLLNQFPDSFIVEEWDLIREAIRANNTYIYKTLFNMFGNQIENLDSKLEEILRCEILNNSTSELKICEILEQSKIFADPLISVCKRIQNKKLSAIIEGVNLPIRLLVSLENTFEYFSKNNNIVLVNLYARNYNVYKERVNKRSQQINFSPISDECFKNINALNIYNIGLNSEQCIKHLQNKIINIDVTSVEFKDVKSIVQYILKMLPI